MKGFYYCVQTLMSLKQITPAEVCPYKRYTATSGENKFTLKSVKCENQTLNVFDENFVFVTVKVNRKLTNVSLVLFCITFEIRILSCM